MAMNAGVWAACKPASYCSTQNENNPSRLHPSPPSSDSQPLQVGRPTAEDPLRTSASALMMTLWVIPSGVWSKSVDIRSNTVTASSHRFVLPRQFMAMLHRMVLQYLGGVGSPRSKRGGGRG